MAAAIRKAGANLAHANAMLSAQVDLTHRLTKHLIAQSELMLITARHEGLSDAQLRQATRGAPGDPEPRAPFFGNPYT